MTTRRGKNIMGYTDAQGRPEIVVNDSIKRGYAFYRHVDTSEPVPPHTHPVDEHTGRQEEKTAPDTRKR